MDNVVVLGQDHRPARLPPIQDLRTGEVLQVLMVGDDADRVRVALQVVSPSYERVHDRQELLVMRLVVDL